MRDFYILLFIWFISCILSPNRENVVSPVRGALLDLRVYRDLVDFPEPLEVMDPRSVADSETDFMF